MDRGGLVAVAPGRSVARHREDLARGDTDDHQDGAPEEHARFLESHELGQIRYVVSAEIGMAFQVGKIPYGVLLDGQGVIRAKGLTNTREHLESLLEADKTGFASLQQFMTSRRKTAA